MKKKIVYCTPSIYIPGGIERVLTTKANYLAEVAGYDVYIVLTDGKGKTPYYPLSPKVNLIQLDINFEELWHLSFLKKIIIYLSKQRIYKKRLKSTLMSLKPDITVSLLRREINFLTSIKDGSKKVGEIHVNREHYRNFEKDKDNFIKRIFASLWQKQLTNKLNQLDKFIVLTEDDRKAWKELNKVEVIPNPLSEYPQKKASLDMKQIISVGRYSYEKGFEMLIKTWKIVNQKHPDWTLNIYGSGNVENLTPLIQKAKLENSIIPHNPITNISSAYLDSSIYVCSSRFEGFGMTLIEAMSCGLPCVSFDCPHGPRNIITDSLNGYLVESENIEALAERICHLIENKELRKNMGKSTSSSVLKYNINIIGQQWNKLFSTLINS